SRERHSEPMNLLELAPDDLTAFFAERGEKPFRARQVSRWLHQRFVDDVGAMSDLAKPLREALAAEAEIAGPRVISDTTAADGTLLAGGIVAPWVDAGRAPITNVVLMGMGEPLANFDNVVPALRLMLDDNAYGLSRRRVTLSTSGLVPLIDRLRDECPVALAVSLHAPHDALRATLVPLNRAYPLSELLPACRRYLDKAPRDFITFEYVMLD